MTEYDPSKHFEESIQERNRRQAASLAMVVREAGYFYAVDDIMRFLREPQHRLGDETPIQRIKANRVSEVMGLLATLKDGAYV